MPYPANPVLERRAVWIRHLITLCQGCAQLCFLNLILMCGFPQKARYVTHSQHPQGNTIFWYKRIRARIKQLQSSKEIWMVCHVFCVFFFCSVDCWQCGSLKKYICVILTTLTCVCVTGTTTVHHFFIDGNILLLKSLGVCWIILCFSTRNSMLTPNPKFLLCCEQELFCNKWTFIKTACVPERTVTVWSWFVNYF